MAFLAHMPLRTNDRRYHQTISHLMGHRGWQIYSFQIKCLVRRTMGRPLMGASPILPIIPITIMGVLAVIRIIQHHLMETIPVPAILQIIDTARTTYTHQLLQTEATTTTI